MALSETLDRSLPDLLHSVHVAGLGSCPVPNQTGLARPKSVHDASAMVELDEAAAAFAKEGSREFLPRGAADRRSEDGINGDRIV